MNSVLTYFRVGDSLNYKITYFEMENLYSGNRISLSLVELLSSLKRT